MTKKKTYTARYTREGDAWTVAYQRPDVATWGPTLATAQRAAREALAVTLDYPSVEELLAAVDVVDLVGQDSELAQRAAIVRARRAQLATEEAEVARETAELGRAFVEQGLSTRDAGSALGVSGARISQTRAG
jgi:hypothetical protein